MSSQSNLDPRRPPPGLAVANLARDGRLRRRIVSIYEAMASDWNGAAATAARLFRGARELRSAERRFAGEAVYELIRWRRRLAFALGFDEAPALPLYLAWLAGQLPGDPQVESELRVQGIAVERLGSVEKRLAAVEPALERLAIAQSYPSWLVARLVAELGREVAEPLLVAMNRRAPLVARANRLKNRREELIAHLTEERIPCRPLALGADALELLTHVNAYGLDAFKEGRFELQDLGSQLIAELAAPPPRGVLVDACAGAGGKTLALGALLANRGRITAFDISAPKLEELRARARRAGLTNVRAHEVAPNQAGEEERALDGRADRVLCDVPCSGLGTLRRHPEARWRLQPADLDELPALQARILRRYAPLVAAGGRLIYATCTVSPRENDAVVDAFLSEHPGFVEVPAKEILGRERALALGDGQRLRLLPQRHDCDGFFAAVLRCQV